jgi:hypothetical protein
MNKHKGAMFLVVLALIASAAGLLAHLKVNQKLGEPGVKTRPLPGSSNLVIELPERVLDFTSELIEEDKLVTDGLPSDTSFGQRLYQAPDGFQTLVNVVLMGSDRTSIHKPQFCLTGSGWTIEKTELAGVPVSRPHPYELPVMKLTMFRESVVDSQRVRASGVYVYWFVAEDVTTARHGQRMWWMAKNLLQLGVLQRWAYVTCFSICLPGQEEATFDRMKQFMTAAVPAFQLTPRADAEAKSSAARPGARAL